MCQVTQAAVSVPAPYISFDIPVNSLDIDDNDAESVVRDNPNELDEDKDKDSEDGDGDTVNPTQPDSDSVLQK